MALDLVIRGGKVAVSAKLLQGQELGADLPEIELRDIGKDKGGATPAEVVEQVIASLSKGVGGAIGALDLDGQTFKLLQFHLHSPSEHRIQGESFALEAHFVHKNDRGELAVVAVLFREGARSDGIATIETSAPAKAGMSKTLDTQIASLEIMPENTAHYRYAGSLTTPPCTEGVHWLVVEAIGSVAKEQVQKFVEIIGENARGPQPLNDRQVVD